MKHSFFRIILCLFLAVCVLPLSLVGYAADTDSVYINSAADPVAFDSLYAIGGGKNTQQLNGGNVYAMTSGGTVEVGEYVPATVKPTATPTVTPTASPEASTAPALTPDPSGGITTTPVPSDVPVSPEVSPEASPEVSASPEPDFTDVPVAYTTVKVGLHYGSTAVDEVYLRNVVGNGFVFGYFDQNRDFHEVGRTNASALTLIPDWNWTTAEGMSFGCYHILPRGSFASYDAAKAEADRLGGFPIYYSGSYFVMVGDYKYIADAEAARLEKGIDGEVISGSRYCVVVTESGTNRILFEYDCGSASSLAIRPLSEDGKPITEYNGLWYYGDFQFSRMSGNQFMTAVNYVDIEDYTKGVIPYEMYVTWPQAALEAQAMCARNYVATNFNRYRAQGFDVTADIYSQVYKGIGDATPITNAAVDASAGKYIRYEGKLCQTFFFSSDGGATESSENVWGVKMPYLVGVVDPYEDDVETYSKNWTYVCTPEDLRVMVNERESVNMGKIVDIDCSYTAMGNMKSMTFVDENGRTHTVNGNRCNVVMGAKSQRFQVTKNGDGNFVVLGSGWGHNCGMSQYGAYSMAKHHDKTAEEIIKFYYTGVYIR